MRIGKAEVRGAMPKCTDSVLAVGQAPGGVEGPVARGGQGTRPGQCDDLYGVVGF